MKKRIKDVPTLILSTFPYALFTIREVAAKLNISVTTARRHVLALHDTGQLFVDDYERVPKGKNYRWTPVFKVGQREDAEKPAPQDPRIRIHTIKITQSTPQYRTFAEQLFAFHTSAREDP